MTTPPEQSTEDGECQHGVMRRYYECPQCDTPERALLQRAAIALPVLRDVLNAASLQGGDVADNLLSDINKELSKPEQPKEVGSCGHGVPHRWPCEICDLAPEQPNAAPDPQPFIGVDLGGKDEMATVNVTVTADPQDDMSKRMNSLADAEKTLGEIRERRLERAAKFDLSPADPQEATPRTDASAKTAENALRKFGLFSVGFCMELDMQALEREAAALRRIVHDYEISVPFATIHHLEERLAAEVEARRVAEQQIAEIKAALTGDDYDSLPSDIPVVRMAHTIRADHDKFRNQVRDTCRRAEQAEVKARDDAKDAVLFRHVEQIAYQGVTPHRKLMWCIKGLFVRDEKETFKDAIFNYLETSGDAAITERGEG